MNPQSLFESFKLPDFSSFTPVNADNSTLPTYSLPSFTTSSQKKSIPSVLSSVYGANTLNENVSRLSNLEKSITIPAGSTLSGLAAQYGTTVQDLMKANPQISNPNLIYAGAKLNLPVTSPATSKMVSSISDVASTNQLSPIERDKLASLTGTADTLMSNAAAARSAFDSRDYTGMDAQVNLAEQNKNLYEKQLSDYYNLVSPLRQQLQSFMTPSEKEQELNRKLLDLRSQADQFALQTEKDKLSEYSGQTQGFAQGRASEIDFKASFKKQEQALQEKNLLAELGLEQDARKMKSAAVEKQLGYLSNDFELQQKVQGKLDEQNKAILDRADKLTTESKNTLLSIVQTMAGTNPDTMSQQTRQSLEQLAVRGGVPFDLVSAALKATYQQKVFDNSIKLQSSMNASNTNPNEPLSLSELEAYGLPAGSTRKDAQGKVPLNTSARTTLNAITNAVPLVDSIGNLVRGLGLADNTRDATFRGGVLQGQSYFPSSTPGQYKAQTDAFLSMIVRALGEKGTLAEGDVARVKASIPGFYDTNQSATNKLNNLRSIMNDVYKKTLQGYYDTPSMSGYSSSNQGNNDPLGILGP